MANKIVLAMIVRDEANTIERCLNSCLGVIDYVAITDTGSTDATIEKINNWSREHEDIQVRINCIPFVNFESTRNANLQEAKKQFKDVADYILLLDADMCLESSTAFDKRTLDGPAYSIQQRNGDLTYFNVRLIRLQESFLYKGVTHEFLDLGDQVCTPIYTLSISDKNDGGHKINKFIRDRALLEAALMQPTHELSSHMKERYTFYLAQTLMDLHENEEALQMYQQRIKLGGWIQERYISHLRRSLLYTRSGLHTEAFKEAWLATLLMAHRSEAYYYIISHLNRQKAYELSAAVGAVAMKRAAEQIEASERQCHLFQNVAVLQYHLPLEYSVALFHTNQQTEFEHLTTLLLHRAETDVTTSETLLKNVSDTLKSNRQFFV